MIENRTRFMPTNANNGDLFWLYDRTLDYSLALPVFYGQWRTPLGDVSPEKMADDGWDCTGPALSPGQAATLEAHNHRFRINLGRMKAQAQAAGYKPTPQENDLAFLRRVLTDLITLRDTLAAQKEAPNGPREG